MRPCASPRRLAPLNAAYSTSDSLPSSSQLNQSANGSDVACVRARGGALDAFFYFTVSPNDSSITAAAALNASASQAPAPGGNASTSAAVNGSKVAGAPASGRRLLQPGDGAASLGRRILQAMDPVFTW